jgi:hypothetical protein
MSNVDDESNRTFPGGLHETRPNWIATGIFLLSIGVYTYSPTDDRTSMIASSVCIVLALTCFTAAAIDGPHIRSQTCTCNGWWFCRLGSLLHQVAAPVKRAVSDSSTEQTHSSNTP